MSANNTTALVVASSEVSNQSPNLVGILTRGQYILIRTSFLYYILPLFELLTIISLVINLIVLAKIGIKESVTLSFFLLTVCDMAYMITSTLTLTTLALFVAGYYRTGLTIAGYISYYDSIFINASMVFTAYIAVVRCCCVALPFKFKSTFTSKTTCVAFAIIIICNVILQVPTLASITLVPSFFPYFNATILRLTFSSNYKAISNARRIVSRTILPNASLLIVCVCIAILVYHLKKASTIRSKMTAITPGEKPKSTLSEKDIRVVKAVIFVSLVQAIAVFATSIRALATVIEPEFNTARRYTFLYDAISQARYLVAHMSIGANIFIYYSFNSKFKEVFLNLFADKRVK